MYVLAHVRKGRSWGMSNKPNVRRKNVGKQQSTTHTHRVSWWKDKRFVTHQ
jgi:hypothetical protein